MNTNKIINAFVKLLTVYLILGVFFSICALAQSLNVTDIVMLFLSVFALNQCCGVLLMVVKPSKQKVVTTHDKENAA